MQERHPGKTEAGWKQKKRQRILEEGFALFSERGIGQVTMPEVAQVCGISRATLYRYYETKLDLVIAIGAWKWDEYIRYYMKTKSEEEKKNMSGAEHLRFFCDSFIDLYRNHRDILRYNYEFNSYLAHEGGQEEQRGAYMRVISVLKAQFHYVYKKGVRDATLNTDISEEDMFSSIFRIMLAVTTRYATGLIYLPETGEDPGNQLVMLEELLLERFCRGAFVAEAEEKRLRKGVHMEAIYA